MSGLTSAFDRMAAQARAKGTTLANQEGQSFLSTEKKIGVSIAPSVDELNAIAVKLGWRLKRAKGVTPQAELQRRIRARKTFARGWAVEKIENSGTTIRIWLFNHSAESDKVDKVHKATDRAGDIVGKKFSADLDKLASSLTRNF